MVCKHLNKTVFNKTKPFKSFLFLLDWNQNLFPWNPAGSGNGLALLPPPSWLIFLFFSPGSEPLQALQCPLPTGLWPPSPHSCPFPILLLFLLLLPNDFYYIYSCTTIITTQFYSISILNPQCIPPPPTCLIWKPCFSKSVSQYLLCKEIHCVFFF